MSGTVVNPDDMLAMSDDDFAKMNPPEATPIAEVVVQEETSAPTLEPIVEEPKVQEEPVQEEAPVEPVVEEEEPKPEGSEQLFDKEGKPIEAPVVEAPKADAPKETVPSTGSSEAVVPAAVTAEQAMDFYSKIMAPIKANGKEIQLKSPEEAMQLIQQGANYTRKMQAIAPHRKVLTMLQNNDLLDEGKLDYLIALDKRDPEAIRKLIKDAGIDPLDIDTSSESTFRAGNHTVTDNEVALQTIMEDLGSTPEGKATIAEVNSNWDQASKEALWDSPEILSVINSQRENGIYDTITAEMNRQKVLGTIPATTPFIKAYQQVGSELYGKADQNSQAPVGSTTPTPQAQPGQVVTPKAAPVALGTTVAAPKIQVKNGDQASAASPTRTTPRKAKEIINPLEMSDEAFMKQFEGRV